MIATDHPYPVATALDHLGQSFCVIARKGPLSDCWFPTLGEAEYLAVLSAADHRRVLVASKRLDDGHWLLLAKMAKGHAVAHA